MQVKDWNVVFTVLFSVEFIVRVMGQVPPCQVYLSFEGLVTWYISLEGLVTCRLSRSKGS